MTENNTENREITEEELKKFERLELPTMDAVIEGYRDFIRALGGNFLAFAELYCKCIEIAKKHEIVGEPELHARIKDFSSCKTNTDHKELDDIFGIEVSTENEEQAEFFILFNRLIFDNPRDIQGNPKQKIYEKQNGYHAYHSTEIPLELPNKEEIKERIHEALKTKVKKIMSKEEIIEDASVFEALLDLMERNGEESIVNALEEMIQTIRESGYNYKNNPMIEFHFMTKQVREESIRGKSSHDRYKTEGRDATEQDQIKMSIKALFRSAHLFRGINAPWKFTKSGSGLVLQNFYDTLLENWPYLREDIIRRREEGKEESDIEKNKKVDHILCRQYSFLKKYMPETKNKINFKWTVSKEWKKVQRIIMLCKVAIDGTNGQTEYIDELLGYKNQKTGEDR